MPEACAANIFVAETCAAISARDFQSKKSIAMLKSRINAVLAEKEMKFDASELWTKFDYPEKDDMEFLHFFNFAEDIVNRDTNTPWFTAAARLYISINPKSTNVENEDRNTGESLMQTGSKVSDEYGNNKRRAGSAGVADSHETATGTKTIWAIQVSYQQCVDGMNEAEIADILIATIPQTCCDESKSKNPKKTVSSSVSEAERRNNTGDSVFDENGIAQISEKNAVFSQSVTGPDEYGCSLECVYSWSKPFDDWKWWKQDLIPTSRVGIYDGDAWERLPDQVQKVTEFLMETIDVPDNLILKFSAGEEIEEEEEEDVDEDGDNGANEN